MTAYYNEHDPFAAQWLRNLIDEGLIAHGVVDTRSIEDIHPAELHAYTQCHFFAGIGGWSVALRMAGWPDGSPVWTGSCPCQPFSAAGKGLGVADPRHLWPAFGWLIGECRPPVVFGEQVAAAAGRAWFAAVRTDLEALAYAVGCADLCAAGVGAPHIRQRLFWVGDACCTGPQGRDARSMGRQLAPAERAGPLDHPWAAVEWLECSDGKARPSQPGLFPLAHGVSNRVGRLRGYGNAIVPQVAAQFIGAYLDARG